MNRWGNCCSEDNEGLNLAETVTAHPDAVALLQVKDFVENVKAKSTAFTKKIVEAECRHILHQFIEIAINPALYMQRNQKPLDKQLTHGAIEVLTSLSEEFVETIFDEEDPREDEVIQTDKDYPIMTFIFKTVTPEVEETGLAYLSKLITPFIYQRPEEMLQAINDETIDVIVAFFWSASVAELITKLLEAEGENDFFEKEKLQLVSKVCTRIAAIEDEAQFERVVENFGMFIEGLVEKHEDKYERFKYAILLKNIIEQVDNFDFLLPRLEKHGDNRVIKTELLGCVHSYLKIHLPVKQGSNLYEKEGKPLDNIRLSTSFLLSLQKYIADHQIASFISDIRLELLNFFKVVKVLLLLSPESAEVLLTESFLSSTLAAMREDPNNNILHNYQKDVVLSGISESSRVNELLQNEMRFDETLRSNLSEGNSRVSYESQLFLIGEAIKIKSEEGSAISEGWNQLQETLKNKRTFYSVIMGGKPGGNSDKWDNFQELILKPLEQKVEEADAAQKPRTQYVMVSRIQQMEGTEVLSEDEDPFADNQETKDDHFFDCELPLDSDEDSRNLRNSSQDLSDVSGENKTGLVRRQDSSSSDFCLPQEEEGNGPTIHVERVNSIVKIDFQESGQISSFSSGIDFSKETSFSKPSKLNTNRVNSIDHEIRGLATSVNFEEDKTLEEQEGKTLEAQEDKPLKAQEDEPEQSTPKKQEEEQEEEEEKEEEEEEEEEEDMMKSTVPQQDNEKTQLPSLNKTEQIEETTTGKQVEEKDEPNEKKEVQLKEDNGVQLEECKLERTPWRQELSLLMRSKYGLSRK